MMSCIICIICKFSGLKHTLLRICEFGFDILMDQHNKIITRAKTVSKKEKKN